MSKTIIQFANDFIRENLTPVDKPSPASFLRIFALEADKAGYSSSVRVDLEATIKSTASIAIISQFAPNYSGGRYYTFEIACALAELGYNVTLYCDNQPPFIKDFIDYKFPKIVMTDLTQIDIEADMYIGSPVLGSEIACSLAIKYNKPVYSLIFDSLPIMQKVKSRNTVDATVRYWERLVRLWQDSNCKMIACSEMTANSARKWLKKKKEDMFILYPAVNSRVLSQVRPQTRRNRAVFVSRIVGHKNIDVVLQAIAKTDWELHIISDTGTDTLNEAIEKLDIKNRVFVHTGVSDTEKFRILKTAKIMVNASTFEGAGIWLEEAQACGLATVCYEWETFKEMDVSGHTYYAKYNDPESFIRQFRKAVKLMEDKSNGVLDYNTYSFDNYMLPAVRSIFRNKPLIGVMMIALNEQKFIGASLKALVRSPYISKIAVVEGADSKFAHAATEKGLSIDNTSQTILNLILSSDPEGKIVYTKYGWAKDKAELRNKCIELLGTDINWLLMVDADEVYKQDDLEALSYLMENHPKASTILMRHLHFWKNKNQVAVGGQWDTYLPRCFRFDDKTLRFREHNLPPVNDKGTYINQYGTTLIADDIHIYHYGYMKSQKDVKAKLTYYKNRDTQLDVKDTWTGWKQGQPTQPTHGGGTVKPFKGTHPEEVKGLL